MNPKEQKEALRRTLAAQARAIERGVGDRQGDNIAPMIDLAMPKDADRMIDVACGAGDVALAFAPYVGHVVGVDVSPELVGLARKRAEEHQVRNADFIEGDPEALRFSQGLFDIVTCRLSFHRFYNPDKALHEMARVLMPRGRIIVYDLIVSDEPKKAERFNEILRLRDDSHTRVLSASEWRDFVRRCGLHGGAKVISMIKRDFDAWMDAVEADADRRARVKEALQATAAGDAAGVGVRVKGDRTTFSLTCAIYYLTK